MMNSWRLLRRAVVKGLGVLAGTLLAGAVMGTRAEGAEGAAKPNVVVILADDMGFSDIGPYGSEIATPSLDRMAKGGMKFKQFYNCARCCPTRASLMTGLYSHQAGIGNMVGAKAQNEKLGGPGYTDQLNASCVTIPEALAPAGYKTLMSGKWHIGTERPYWPCDRGFEESFVLINGAMNYFGHNFQEARGGLKMNLLLAKNNTLWEAPQEGFYSTDAFADEAIGMIKGSVAEKKPFFLYLAFNAPHFPLQAKAEDIAKYEGKYAMGWEKLREQRHQRQMELGIVDAKWGKAPADSDAGSWDALTSEEQKSWGHRMAVYAAQVECLDRNIGRVMDGIKAAGVEENTLVMFMSDNGASAEKIDRGAKGAEVGAKESWSSYHMGWAHASDTPFRMYKHWDHEGGISSPFIAYWPGHIQAGTTSNQVGHVMDMMPTALEVAGAAYPKEFKGKASLPVEGKSLLPIFLGKDAAVHDMLFWEHEGNKAVRDGDLKLVAKFGGAWELYDMAADRTELHDLAKERGEDVKRLAAAWQGWAERCNVRPWVKGAGKPGE